MSRSSRFPRVLHACLHSLPAPYCVAKRLGILPFCFHTTIDPTRPGRGFSLVIGPPESWFNADRANQLLTDEALRVLQDEYSIEQIGAMLLARVPEWQGSIGIFSGDRDNRWAIGRHPEMLWFWHFKSLFRVLDTTAPSTPPTPAGGQPAEGEKPDAQSAKQLLHGWRAIDEALGLSRSYPNMNNDERRRKLAYLNRRFGGPIKAGGKGSQPVVNRSELIAWWNSLEELVEDQKARIRDKQATLQSRHPYGRAAQVAPDLGGSVKRRKSSSRKPDKT
jgi:hypothetical protein